MLQSFGNHSFLLQKKGHFCSECPERKDEMKQTAAVAVTSDELFAFNLL